MDQGQRRDVLRQAEDELRRAVSEHGWRSPQADAARQQQRALERSTAAEMGLPYAEPADLGVQWDAGAPMPVLISGLRTFVAFYLRIDDPLPFDETNSSVWDPRPEIGVVEFKRVASVKKGSPNDEVLHGHPLWGSGLEFYRAHEVRNSPWIKELTDVNRVHGGFDESRWNRVRHFVLTFHDETVECVAQEAVARSEPPAATMPQVVISLSDQTVG